MKNHEDPLNDFFFRSHLSLTEDLLSSQPTHQAPFCGAYGHPHPQPAIFQFQGL